MNKALFHLSFCAFVAIVAPLALAQDDAAGSQDPPGMTRMASYYIRDYTTTEFDSYSFKVTVNNRTEDKVVEGKHYEIRYDLKDGANTPSPLQVIRNYQNAARAAGGQVVYQGEDETTIRMVRGGSETWARIEVAIFPAACR